MRHNQAFVPVLLALSILCCQPATAQSLKDVITVGTVTASSSTADVPVFIRDVSGTPLGLDQPPGSRIQSYSIKVNYAPASAVSSITFSRAGITAPLTPSFEAAPSSAGSISLLDTFQESTNLIPFTLNAAVPGNQVAHLVFTLSPSAIPGSAITLTLDPTLTQLANDGGTTSETTSNASLALVNGSITIPLANVVANTPTLSPWLLAFLAVALVVVALVATRGRI
jgi:hypothetical protein